MPDSIDILDNNTIGLLNHDMDAGCAGTAIEIAAPDRNRSRAIMDIDQILRPTVIDGILAREILDRRRRGALIELKQIAAVGTDRHAANVVTFHVANDQCAADDVAVQAAATRDLDALDQRLPCRPRQFHILDFAWRRVLPGRRRGIDEFAILNGQVIRLRCQQTDIGGMPDDTITDNDAALSADRNPASDIPVFNHLVI